MLAIWITPNNHTLDRGKASSEMEKEAVVLKNEVCYIIELCRWDKKRVEDKIDT